MCSAVQLAIYNFISRTNYSGKFTYKGGLVQFDILTFSTDESTHPGIHGFNVKS